MPLSLSVFSQSGPPICTPIWAFFRAFKALKALKGPQIKFSPILMHRPYRDLLNLKFSCLYLFPFSHKVVPQKASGGSGGGGVGGRIPHFNWSIYRGGNFFFFFLFWIRVKIGRKIDWEWSRRSEMFGWGSFLGVVATTLIYHVLLRGQTGISGRWQAPAAVLPEGPKDIGYERASPRARGRAELNVRFGACQCYYMFFTTQLKIVNFTA